MARIIVELTNRCNLRCGHCFPERHAGTGDLPLAVIETILRDGHACGIDHVCFTGGEPTLHRQFRTIVEKACAAGYTFSFVSNGRSFGSLVPLLLAHRGAFRGVTFSLDGALEATHDRLRGTGSYRQVMRAATACAFKGLPFTFNMVLTSHNRHEVDDMVHLATRLGSRGIRFGHLMFAPDMATPGLQLSPTARREVEAHVWDLKARSRLPVGMAPGYYSESPFFPCAPLELREYNVDHRGNLTLCCQLSGHAGTNASDVMGNLGDITLAEACRRFERLVMQYLTDKRARLEEGTFEDVDHFPCWYCVKYVGKVSVQEAGPASGWRPVVPAERRIHVSVVRGTPKQ